MKSDRTFALQYAARALGHPVRADGVLGDQTREALAKIEASGNPITANMMKALPEAPQVGPGRLFVPNDVVNRAVASAASLTGVPVSYLRQTVVNENFPAAGGFETTQTGNFRGLGQFNAATWNGIRKQIVSLPPYEVGSKDPMSSVLAIAYLYLDNKRQFAATFPRGKYGDEIAYLYHNQGGPAAASFLRTGKLVYPKQSAKALATFTLARTQHGNEDRAIA